MIKPTQQQIKLATNLQRKRFCQGAKEKLYYHHKWWCSNEQRFIQRGFFFLLTEYKNTLDKVRDEYAGPLPTAKEVWPELKELIPSGYILSFSERDNEICIKEDAKHGEIIWETYFENFDIAFAQGLIAMYKRSK